MKVAPYSILRLVDCALFALLQEEDITGSCATGRDEHECLTVFRSQPAIVKILGLEWHLDTHCR